MSQIQTALSDSKAKEIVSSAPFVVLSVEICGHSKWVTNLLTQQGADFRVFELDLERDGSDIQSALAEWTVQRKLPIVFIGGNHVLGYESTINFFTRMLWALEDSSLVNIGQNLDIIKKFELSLPPVAVDTVQLRSQLPTVKTYTMSCEPVIDSEDREVSDDDDRNHKHRKREAQSSSLVDDDDDDVQEPSMRQAGRKRNKPLDNQRFFQQNSVNGKMESSSKFEKRQSIFTHGMRDPSDFVSRARINQTFHTDGGPYSDKSTSTGRPLAGRGRGRSTISWNHQESKFNPLDNLDFAAQVVSQGLPTHPSLFIGAGIPSAPSTQNASWGTYGFVPGMSNRILDPLQPLSLQGALQPTITQLFNMGMSRQRCRDFDEQGFCLRGDICPMEHGVNRIVIEDVQSLSQFNLSVSDPNSHAMGIRASSKSLPAVSASSGPIISSKFTHIKDGKHILADDTLKLRGISSTSSDTEADVYDPDQPLWNNETQKMSGTGLMLSLPNNEPLWNVNSSQQSLEQNSKISSEKKSSQNTDSSVWGRIGHGSMSETDKKTRNNLASTSYLLDEMKEDNEKSFVNSSPAILEKKFTDVMSKKATDSSRNSGRMTQKASRTLYVHGIPQNNNTKNSLLSHFQKFGEVVDIYIPLNSEKGFVQFSKREEAKAALEAPDAVMGNRFIKLWWANRDRVSHGQKSSIHAILPTSMGLPPVQSHPCGTEKGKGNLPSPVPTRSKTSTPEMPVALLDPKCSSANIPIIASPVQKRLDLELLKEELHKKQEILAQKRSEFRQQLHKFEKQAVSVKKGEVATGQVAKRLKVDACGEATKAEMPRGSIDTQSSQQEVENTTEIQNSNVPVSSTSGSIPNSPNSNTEQTSHLPVPELNTSGSDNQPTSFRILPPLPADFADVVVLKDHFSPFGDLTSVSLEDPIDRNEDESIKSPENCTACITFTSSDSAERAYSSGGYWRGHSLQFVWLSYPSTTRNCDNKHILGPPGSSNAGIQANQATSAASSPAKEESADGLISEVAAVVDGESSEGLDGAHSQCNDGPNSPSRASHTNSNMLSCEESCLADVPDAEDKKSIGLTQ